MFDMLINVVIVVMSLVAWLMVMLGRGDTRSLSESGRRSLRYFTVLSNLFSGFVSLIALVGAGMWPHVPTWLLALKLVATSSVMVTFLTVVLLLGPQLGWRFMYMGGNLWMHLILPLLATVDCLLYVPVGTLPFGYTLLCIVPVFLYGAWYIAMVALHGTKKGNEVYDFYGFFQWGIKMVPVVAVVMLLASWVVGLALWLGCRALGVA